MLKIKKRTLIAVILTVLALVITNNFWFTAKAHADVAFEFELFVIILVLSYLSSYKLADYVANFSSIKHKSRIEILFLTIFFVLLFLPAIKIDKSEISIKENRALQKWQPLVKEDGKFNYDFGRNFEAWFNDRFFLRDGFIKLSTVFKFKNKKVLQGKEDWLFFAKENTISNYQNNNTFTQLELTQISD